MRSRFSRPTGAPNAMAEKKPERRPEPVDGETRLAPDPFTAVLPALAALGAIASIATINWAAAGAHARSRSGQAQGGHGAARSRNLLPRPAGDLPPLPAQSAAVRRRRRQAASPLKFGVHGPRVATDAARLFQQLINDVASMLVLASQNAFDVMSAVEDGEIDAPEELFFGFGEQQERLNKLIQARATLKASVDTGAEVAQRLTELVRELKKHRTE